MKQLYALLFFAFCGGSAFAQPAMPQWVQPYAIQNVIGKSDIMDIAGDAAGNSYVTGYFDGNLFLLGGDSLTGNFNRNGFVAKLDGSGNTVWWKTFLATQTFPQFGIAADPAGNSYVSGIFCDTLRIDTSKITGKGWQDVYLFKLNTNGELKWLRNYGSTVNDECAYFGKGIAAVGNNGVCLTGIFGFSYQSMPSYPIDSIWFDGHLLTTTGFSSAFVARIDSSGNAMWAVGSQDATQNTVMNSAQAFGLCTDPQENVYITGFYYGTSFKLGNQSAMNVNPTRRDAYLAKLDGNGNALWVNTIGGHDDDLALACAADAQENVYLTAEVYGDSVQYNPGLWMPKPGGNCLVKYSPSGAFLWHKPIPTGWGSSLQVSPTGNLTLTGNAGGTVFPGAPVPMTGGGIYLGQLSSSGAYRWHTTAAGIDITPNRILLRGNGAGIVVGKFKGCPIDFYPYAICATDQSAFAVPFTYPTAMDDVAPDAAAFTIFPVPAHDLLYINGPASGRLHAGLYNSLGQTIRTAGLNTAGNGWQMGIRGIPAGAYLLRCTNAVGSPVLRQTVVLD